MPKYCFISVMGTQIMGTINPLLALLADGLDISSVYLLVSDKVVNQSVEFEAFCTSRGILVQTPSIAMPPDQAGVYPYAYQAAVEIAKSATERGEQIIFNLNGSTNQMLAQCCYNLTPFNPLWIQATQKRFLLDDNGSLRQCRSAEVITAQEIFSLQGAEVQDFDAETKECSIFDFCRQEKIALPSNVLVNKKVGGVFFDLIWTDANNRLAFLVSCLQKELPQESKYRLAHERTIAHWAAGRDRSLNLFDRSVYVLTDNDNTAEHLRSESNNKVSTVDCKGHAYKKDILSQALRTLFAGQSMHPAQNIQAKQRKALDLADDTLIVALGKDPSATLLAINSHNPQHVMLCHTEDLKDQATCLRSQCAELGVKDIRLVSCDYEGYVLPSCFITPQNPDKVYVNISPGTKGQGVYLAIWAKKVGCAVWAVQPQSQTLERLDVKSESIKLSAPDPLLLFGVRGERMQCDRDGQATYTERNSALLAFLRSGLGHDRENDIFNMAVKIDGVTLHRPALKDWELRMPNGEVHPFSLEGGEWLELLAAEAFKEAGSHFSHARVRNLGSTEREQAILERKGFTANTHLMDIDVLGSYGGGHFLVSCKANPKTSFEETIQEAHNMAKSVDRFTVALVCHLGCHKAYYDEKYGVMVFGWRELCQPKILKSYLEELRAKF